MQALVGVWALDANTVASACHSAVGAAFAGPRTLSRHGNPARGVGDGRVDVLKTRHYAAVWFDGVGVEGVEDWKLRNGN